MPPTPYHANDAAAAAPASARPADGACTASTWPPGPAHRPIDEDSVLAPELDIRFSTHLTVVVPVRVEFDGGAQAHEVDLVIPRRHCRDGRPRLQALLEAVLPALGRGARPGAARGRPRALLARIAGQWQALCPWPSDMPGHVALAR